MSFVVESYNILFDTAYDFLQGYCPLRVGDYVVMEAPVSFGRVARSPYCGVFMCWDIKVCETLDDARFYASLHDEACGLSESGGRAYEVEIWHVVDDLEQVTRYDWHRFALEQARELRLAGDDTSGLSADLSWIHAQASAAPCSHSCAVCCLCNVDAGGWRLCERYQRCELEALLGDFVDEYDVDGIEREVTAFCPLAGCVVLLPSFQGDDSLYDVLSRHCKGVTVDA